jgi:oxygen-independent coproporphyrinogen-3 oxidase
MTNLIAKYNVAAPRYTSYPSVPYWDSTPTEKQWEKMVKASFDEANTKKGISIYIHLPFCESLCTFCGCNTRITINHDVEEPYIDVVLKEWSFYKKILKKKPLLHEIHLGGGTPTFFKPKNLERLLKGILSDSEIHSEHSFGFEAHPTHTTEEHLLTLYDLGFKRISLGIQDFNPKVLEIINRKQSYEWIKWLTERAREIGYSSINYDLIYGLPLQTPSCIEDTMHKVITLKPNRIAFYSYAHVPWLKPSQRKFTEDDLPTGENKFALFELGKKMLLEGGYQTIGMDHFALPDDSLSDAVKSKTLHRNFMGYTDFHTRLLIGLGVSSISDAWSGFVQNAKVVEEYYKLLEENKIPFIKGHILSNEDAILRKHILNLMCFFKTSWYNKDEQCDALYKGIERMEEMQKDGLVLIGPFEVEITEKGKFFVRNICMALDARMHRQEMKKQKHSTVV